MSQAASTRSAVSEFGTFLSNDWNAWLAEYPEVASQVGVPGHNGRWTDDSPTGIGERRQHLARSLEAIRRTDRTRLDASDQLNYDLYRDLLELATTGVEFGDDPLPLRSVVPRSLVMPLHQLDGVHLSAPETLDLQPRGRPSDVADLLARLEALPALIDQQIALLRAGLARGFSPPRVTVRGVPEQVAALTVDEPRQNPLLRPLTEFPERLPARDRAEWLARGREIHRRSIRSAVDRLSDYLVREYLPACRESIAATALPDGPRAYAHHVRLQTTTELSPAEIHAVGLAEVARIRSAMEALARSTGFTGSLREFNEFLRTDPRFTYRSERELLDGYRAVAKTIDPALPRLFGRLPRLPYGVVPVPEFRARSSPAAYYMPGAPEAGRPGFFYANTYDLSARYRWEMEGLALHEAVPGHHLQIALGQELEGLPEFRRNGGYGAFVEGWGLYAESLGEELGLYQDPYSRFGQLTYDMWRSIRLVVDTGMHALGWSRERAIEFFRDNTGKSDLDISVEVDRYIVWPGQALGYKIGQLKFRELRTLAEQRLGDRFDVRRFHDRVLEEGALPLGVLDRRVRAWVDSGGGTSA